MDRTRAAVFAAVLVACIGCDHASKLAATALLAPAETVSFASGALRFELAYNEGAFLGLGSALPPALRMLVLGALVPLALCVFVVRLLRTGSPAPAELVALGLVAGGGLGNWLDRVASGGLVTDFVSVGYGPLRTGIFNFADVALVGGVLLLLLIALTASGEEPPPRVL
jgi:signal peptidase II